MKEIIVNNLTSAIDQLGLIKAQIADLKSQEQALRDVLAAQGAGSFEGELFRATVSVGERATLDMAAVRAKLSRQFIQANTNITEVVTVRVSARNNVRIAA